MTSAPIPPSITLDLGWSKMLIVPKKDATIDPGITQVVSLLYQKIEASTEPNQNISYLESLDRIGRSFERLYIWEKNSRPSFHIRIELSQSLKELTTTEQMKAYLINYPFSKFIVEKLPDASSVILDE